MNEKIFLWTLGIVGLALVLMIVKKGSDSVNAIADAAQATEDGFDYGIGSDPTSALTYYFEQ